MLILNEVHELGRVSLPKEIKGPHLEAGSKAVDDIHGLVGPQGLLQHVLGIFQTAAGDVVTGHGHLIEFADDLSLLFCADLLMVGNLQGDPFDFFIIHMLEQLGRILRPQCYKQDGSFFLIGKFAFIFIIIHTSHKPSFLRKPGLDEHSNLRRFLVDKLLQRLLF